MVAGGVFCLTGCGTMFYSERVGQPHSRDIDWKVAALNGLGLALFFIPGVVAFAVDFYTGAIYLPYETYGPYPAHPPTGEPAPIELSQSPASVPAAQQHRWVADEAPSDDRPSQTSSPTVGGAAFHRIDVAPAELNQRSIEEAVTRHVGQSITLTDSGVRISRLSHLRQFPVAYRQHRSDPSFGLPPKQFFKRLPAV
jgi:hypothetical protein